MLCFFFKYRNLSIAVLVRISNLRDTTGHRFTGAVQVEALRDVVDGVRSCRLAHAIDLCKPINMKNRRTGYISGYDVVVKSRNVPP